MMDMKEAVRKIRDISQESFNYSGPYPSKFEVMRVAAHAHRRIKQLAESLTVICESLAEDEDKER